MRIAIILMALVPAACSASSEKPELACQQRIADARLVPSNGEDDPFGAAAYAKIDKNGCSEEQLGDIKAIVDLATNLPIWMKANEDAAKSGNEAAHMEAFQKFNNGLIAIDDLQDVATDKLEKMKAAAR